MEAVKRYIEENRQAILDHYFEALRIPSVSALPEHQGDMRKMAEWHASFLRDELHFEAKIIETASNPLVYAESPKVEGAPTVLVYGHYDVQPVDPLDQWKTPPFEPTIQDGKVFCRGADDDKGQSLTHLFAAQALLATSGKLPVQMKFILDGEEEVGSMALSQFLTTEEGRRLLAADVILVSDTDMPGPGQPGITYGLRGVVGFELEIAGACRDLHSGLYGGSVQNPAIILSRLLASIIDENGRIQIPGFYDDVLDLSEDERQALAELPFDETESLTQIGLQAGFGEPGYSALERRGARPSFDINGLTSGYQGVGGKTIIPATATAKFTFRLVPNQDAEKLRAALQKFLEERLPAGVKMNLTFQQGAGGMVVSLDSPAMKAASGALESVFRKKPYFLRDGGSIPIVAELKNRLGSDLLLVGYGLVEDGIHSPNESFPLDSFFQGIAANAAILRELAKIGD